LIFQGESPHQFPRGRTGRRQEYVVKKGGDGRLLSRIRRVFREISVRESEQHGNKYTDVGCYALRRASLSLIPQRPH